MSGTASRYRNRSLRLAAQPWLRKGTTPIETPREGQIWEQFPSSSTGSRGWGQLLLQGWFGKAAAGTGAALP